MNHWKWLLISLGLVAAASIGMIGCGDEERPACSTHSDCNKDAGEICIGVCVTTCTNNSDCDEDAGEICRADIGICDSGCRTDADCDEDAGESCRADIGICELSCTTDSDCDEDAGESCDTSSGVCEGACRTADDCEWGTSCSAGCAGSDGHAFCFQACLGDGDCSTDGTLVCDLSFCGSEGLCIPASNCTSDDQCDVNSICADSICVEKCISNDGCGASEACNVATGHCIALGAGCVENEDCGESRVCDDGVCAPRPSDFCSDQQTCYDRGNEFCAGATMSCQDTSCGVSFNSCSRCTSGPNGGDRDTGAPQIFEAFQDPASGGAGGKNCPVDLIACAPDAPLVCEFGFFAFDPDDAALPSTNLSNHVGVVSSSGRFSTTFGVKRGSKDGLTTFSFRACFAEGGSTASTAAFLTSASNPFTGGMAPTSGRSNTLCTIGTK